MNAPTKFAVGLLAMAFFALIAVAAFVETLVRGKALLRETQGDDL